MKYLLIIISLSFFPYSFSQSGIEFSYNDVYIGRNFSLQWTRQVSALSFYAGATYHVNRIDQIPYSTFIKKSAYATNFGQRMGLHFGLEYYFFQNSNFKTGVFYNNQISSIDQTHITYGAYDTLVSNPQSESDYLYVYSNKTFGPFITIDNVLGLTLHCNLTNNLYLKTKGGFGFLLWKNTDDDVLLIGGKKNNQSYNFTSFFSIGLGYTFNKRADASNNK